MRRLALAILEVVLVAVLAFPSTQYRGVNVSLENADRATLEYLATNWNANIIRVVLRGGGDWTFFIPDPQGVIPERDWKRLDGLIDDCDDLGLRVVICLHQWEGYEYLEGAEDDSIWVDLVAQQSLIDFWGLTACRYSNRGDVLYGYDILNEPLARFTYSSYSTAKWIDLAERVTTAIREQDAKHPVIVEGPRYGSPMDFEDFEPIRGDNIIYSFHLWQPEAFTHTGMPGQPHVDYPSASWDKETLRALLGGVVEFGQLHDVPVFAGEVGVSAYANPLSCAIYLDDALSLFEEFGFDYCLWSYCEAGMSSLEHGPWSSEGLPDVCHVGATEALSVFLQYLSRNERAQLPPPNLPTCLFDQSGWKQGSRETAVAADLLWRATRVLNVTKHSGVLTAEETSGFDVVVISNEGPTLTSEGIQDLVEYVRQGGGLLVHGAPARRRGTDQLLAVFGIQPTNGLVLSLDAVDGSVGRHWGTLAAGNEICDGVLAYLVDWGTGVRTESAADTIVWSSETAWVDTDNDRHKDVTEPAGPVSLVVATQFGSGRVAVIPDYSFWHPVNHSFLINVFEWLAES